MFNYSIIKLIEKTLDYVDPRLMNHGKRVAYLVYTALKRYGKYDIDDIEKVTLLALLHDIGAYKTEEIDKMIQFETEKVWEHSAYGYLFVKNFTPLYKMAPIILFHHANCKEIEHLTPSIRELAQLIHIADRFDILMQTKKLEEKVFKGHFDKLRDTHFYSNLVDLFFMGDWKHTLDGIDDDQAFINLLYHGNISDDDINAYIKMIVLAIDFKSPQTVIHTYAMACASRVISELLNIDPVERSQIYLGAMIHDLGKISIPSEILEKPGRLTEAEMEIMKKHVVVTEEILHGDMDDKCIQFAIRHHEKLNGTGYPKGLNAKDLTTGQRLVAIADIFSALYGVRSYKASLPKEKIIDILESMAGRGEIDSGIVSLVIEKYDYLIDELNKTTQPIMDIYHKMQMEYADLLEKLRRGENISRTFDNLTHDA